jgi:hypothetical protein
MAGSDLLEHAIAGHGGRELWDSLQEVNLRLSAGGLAFSSKLQGAAVRGVNARVSTRSQHVVFSPYPRDGQRGLLRPDGSVRIETDAGEVVRERADARGAFAGLRHRFWWDSLDMLYFGTYALWTYVCSPFVFAGPGYEVTEIEPWSEHGERWRRLAVTFPPGIQTHSREQVFHVDDAGLIRRHDYTADPIGAWAKVAHYLLDYEDFAGLRVPTRRRVYPRRGDGRSRPWPRLVWIEVGDVSASGADRQTSVQGL